MDEELDVFLRAALVSVPEDFTERVMRGVGKSPRAALYRNRFENLHWMALACGMAVGAVPLFAFIFSAWAVSSVN
jgi:hypothetical protein